MCLMFRERYIWVEPSHVIVPEGMQVGHDARVGERLVDPVNLFKSAVEQHELRRRMVHERSGTTA